MRTNLQVYTDLATQALGYLRGLVALEPDKVWHGTIDGGDTAVAALADDRSLSLTINSETGILQILCTAFLHPEAPEPPLAGSELSSVVLNPNVRLHLEDAELAKLLAEEQEIEQAEAGALECAYRFDLLLALDEPDLFVVVDDAGERTVYA